MLEPKSVAEDTYLGMEAAAVRRLLLEGSICPRVFLWGRSMGL